MSIVDPNDPTQPDYSVFVPQLADEIRALKQKLLDVQTQPSGKRNRVTNGRLRLFQDSPSISLPRSIAAGAYTYTVDGIYTYSSGAACSFNLLNQGTLSTRIQLTGAAGVTAVGVGARIEDKFSLDLAGSNVGIQAKLSSSSLTSVAWAVYSASTANTWGTLAAPTRTLVASGSWTITSIEAKYTAQIAVGAGVNTGLELIIAGAALGAGQTLTIGDVQVEKGAAGEVETLPYDFELQAAYRYLWAPYATFVVAGWAGVADAHAFVHYPTPVEMFKTGVSEYGLANNVNVTELSPSHNSKGFAGFIARSAGVGAMGIDVFAFRYRAQL